MMSINLQKIIAPLLALVLIIFAFGYFSTFTTLTVKRLGYDDYIIGSMHSSFYAGMLLSSFVCAYLIRRYGQIVVFCVSAIICGMTAVCMGMIENPYVWMSMRFLSGGFIGLVYIAIESWMLAISIEENRGRILAIYGIALYAAQASSQFMLDIINELSSIPFVFAAVLSAASITPLFFEKTPVQSEEQKNEKGGWIEILLRSPFGIFGCLVSGVILGTIYCFLPPYSIFYNHPTSWIMSLTIFGGVLFQWPLGKLSDLMNRDRVLVFTSLATLIPCHFLYYFPDSFSIVAINVVLLGGFTFSLYPQAIACSGKNVPDVSVATLTSLMLMIYGLGSTLGPMFIPQVTTLYGISSIFIVFAILSSLLALWGTLQSRKDIIADLADL